MSKWFVVLLLAALLLLGCVTEGVYEKEESSCVGFLKVNYDKLASCEGYYADSRHINFVCNCEYLINTSGNPETKQVRFTLKERGLEASWND